MDASLPKVFDLRPSRYLLWVTAVLHASCFVLLLGLGLRFHGLLPGIFAPVLSFWLYRKKQAGTLRLIRSGNGRWLQALDVERTRAIVFLPDSLLTSWLVILNFRDDRGRRFTRVVLPDCLPADDFRQLRVALKLSG